MPTLQMYDKKLTTPYGKEKKSIHVLAPAKLNLFLKITGKRENGYHKLVSIFVPVSLYDELVFTRTGHELEFYCKGKKLPEGEKNLVNRAARLFFDKSGLNPGVRIILNKNIPIASGLGGGSSDAAATLKGLNRLFECPLPEEGLNPLAVSLGADVPFFLKQSPALVTGIGEKIEPIKMPPGLWYVIFSPAIEVSTEWAYKKIKLKLTKNLEQDIIDSLKIFDYYNIPDILSNDLEKVTLERHPFLCLIKASLIDSGARGSLMTGSGPSLFGVFDSKKQANEGLVALSSLKDEGEIFLARGLE